MVCLLIGLVCGNISTKNITKCSVVTYLSCGGIFNNHFTANLLTCLTLIELRKSVGAKDLNELMRCQWYVSPVFMTDGVVRPYRSIARILLRGTKGKLGDGSHPSGVQGQSPDGVLMVCTDNI